MNFATYEYFLFLTFVGIIYWQLNKTRQNLFLMLVSYFFYACWDWRFLSLILISTVTDYFCGMRIHHSGNQTTRKFWLILSLGINLGILGYFKYFNFFLESFVKLAQGVGLMVSAHSMEIILPVGISFYTFQTMSYSLDIYRRQLEPTRSFIDFAAFVAFFPQLVAGPIVRAREFLFQLEKRRKFNLQQIESGAQRFLLGLFKKSFVADTLAVHLVDPVFLEPGNFSTGVLWFANMGYAAQIYADFSGYSSMAIGSARMLGFSFPENFKFPYLAVNFSDFWRRWHLTMSRFFRDYVYFSLGGNRRGTAWTMANLFITTLVSGLWHGAGWTYVIWGGLHGAFTAIFHLCQRWKTKLIWLPRMNLKILQIIAAWLITQFGVCVAWILFRAQDFPTAGIYLKGLFQFSSGQSIDLPWLVWFAFGAVIIDHIAGWFIQYRSEVLQKIPVHWKALAIVGMIIFLYHARPAAVNPFIYFQF